MFCGCDVRLELTRGRKAIDLSAEASTVDEVNDTDVDLFQFLAKSVSVQETHQPARAFMNYLLALRDGCWDRRDPEILTQSLQARQLFHCSTSLNAPNISIGQSAHILFPLLLVSIAPIPLLPALRNGKLIELIPEFGLRVAFEVRETIEIGLLGHVAHW